MPTASTSRGRCAASPGAISWTRLADQLGERALAAGFDHVARKPAHVDALHARIHDLVGRSRLIA